ncbi:MAG: hypothetical protein KA232_13205 [Chryseobacterium sp.]|nr:hypothetical protein [Chryseobacterium sp.]
MKKEVFKENLDGISKLTLEIARKIAWNNLSENIYYIIRPNILADSDHLDNEEKTNLKERKKELRKTLTIDQVLSRLYFSERIPVWINVSIAEATKKKTTIELVTSRRFRKDDYMFKNTDYPPFNIAIERPINLNENEIFDINWKRKKLKLKLDYWKWNFENWRK